MANAPERVAVAGVRLAADDWSHAHRAIDEVLARGGAATFATGDVLVVVGALGGATDAEPLQASLARAFGPTTHIAVAEGSVQLAPTPDAYRSAPVLSGAPVDAVLRELMKG
jgi:hypothetical protein